MNCYKCRCLGLLKYEYKNIDKYIVACCDCSFGLNEYRKHQGLLIVDEAKLKFFKQIDLRKLYKEYEPEKFISFWNEVINNSIKFWGEKYEDNKEFKLKKAYKD